MAQRSIPGGFIIPHTFGLSSSDGAYELQLSNTTNTKVAYCFFAPKAGTLTTFGFRTGAVGPSKAIRISLQEVLSTGFPSESNFDASTPVVIPNPLAQTTYLVTFTTPGIVTAAHMAANLQLAGVAEFDSTLGNVMVFSGVEAGYRSGVPYMAKKTATWAKDGLGTIRGAIGYSDGTFPYTGMQLWSYDRPAFNSGSVPNERAMAFKLPCHSRASHFGMPLKNAPGGDFDVILYDGDGVTILDTMRFTAAKIASSSTYYGYVARSWPKQVELKRDVIYRVGVKPLTATNVVTLEHDVAVYDKDNVLINPHPAGLVSLLGGSTDFYLSTRTGAGAWTDTPTIRPLYYMGFSEVNDGILRVIQTKVGD